MSNSQPLPRRVLRIVLTGGAAAGKSSILTQLTTDLRSSDLRSRSWDFPTAIVPECATQLLEKGYTPERYGQAAFQHTVFRHQLQNENSAFRKMLPQSKSSGKPVVLLCDRGLCDGGAYIQEETFTTICRSFDYSRKRLLGRYQAVLFLDSAATLPMYQHSCTVDFDVQEGNVHRLEKSREEVLATATAAYAAWQDHPHLIPIAAEENMNVKIENVRKAIWQILETYR